jgi:hypothetical protein
VYTTGYQFFPAVAMDADGDFVVVWTDYAGRDGSLRGAFGQRSARAGRGSVPSSGSTRTRATLIGGAVGGGCTRCDGPSIETYIASILGQLDVDRDGGAPMALTDGLLILRYLSGSAARS